MRVFDVGVWLWPTLLIFAGALPTPARAQEVEWTLKGAAWLSEGEAARFVPSGGRAPVEQQDLWRDVTFRGEGQLTIPGGEVTLSRGGADGSSLSYQLAGPSLWRLSGITPRCLSGCSFKYADASSESGGAVTQVIQAVAEGTKYRVEVGANGTTLVVVRKGAVHVRWRDPTLHGEARLAAGQAAIAFMGGRFAGQLKTYEDVGEATDTWRETRGGTRGVRTDPASAEQPLEARAQQALVAGDVDAALRLLVQLARESSNAEELPTLLFEAWQVALVQGKEEQARQAAQVLQRVAGQSTFARMQKNLERSGAGGAP